MGLLSILKEEAMTEPMSPEEFVLAVNYHKSFKHAVDMIKQRDTTIRQAERAKAEGLFNSINKARRLISFTRNHQENKKICQSCIDNLNGALAVLNNALTKFNNEEKPNA